jgi:hypothetical protein
VGGGGSAMVVNLSFFLMSRRLFCERDADEGRKKIRSDLKTAMRLEHRPRALSEGNPR